MHKVCINAMCMCLLHCITMTYINHYTMMVWQH